MGRAVVREPAVFLFDEPLSNLDAKLRVQMRVEISRLHRELSSTMLYVTHDQVEAMTLADRIAIMSDAVLQQCAAPMALYNHPVNRFVAGFIGSPAMNFLSGEFHGGGYSFAGMRLPWRPQEAAFASSISNDGRGATLGIRPHQVTLGGSDVRGGVTHLEPMGAESFAHVLLESGERVVVRFEGDKRLSVGEHVGLGISREHYHIFDGQGVNITQPPRSPQTGGG